jgi:hypothetical protein
MQRERVADHLYVLALEIVVVVVLLPLVDRHQISIWTGAVIAVGALTAGLLIERLRKGRGKSRNEGSKEPDVAALVRAGPEQSPAKEFQGLQPTRPADRIVVDVTPKYLAGLFEQHMNIQAKKLVEVYQGKWIRVSGSLGDVFHNQVVFSFWHDIVGPTVFMYGDAFIERCSLLRRGTQIEVIGRIGEVNKIELHLYDCELISP